MRANGSVETIPRDGRDAQRPPCSGEPKPGGLYVPTGVLGRGPRLLQMSGPTDSELRRSFEDSPDLGIV